MLPTIALGGRQITRLIIGGNPFKGNSHFSNEMDLDMRDYFTVARIKQTLFACERHGINTMQLRGDAHVLACVREFWAEGGRMNFIVQTASELRDLDAHVRSLAEFGVLAVYVHGTWTDRHYQEGNLAPVRELIATIRDTGLAPGLGTHIPEVIERAEEEDWGLDFYMACLYNLSVRKRESAVITGKHDDSEHFDPADRFKMLETIRRTPKTCLAFKILGSSRLCTTPEDVRSAFEVAYHGIKPQDACVVGMFPKYADQVAENVGIVGEILGSSRAVGA